MSAEIPAFPFNILEKVERETFNCSAASVNVKFSGTHSRNTSLG
ncbi:hypothetical protein D521_1307 [beta proteobacterium CB]|nr:hypothetical protein D521_1307 [beta proteobacterium CB]